MVIGGTRVIYPEKEREITVKLTNAGKSPVLAQSWIDDGNVDSKPDNISVPFLLIPSQPKGKCMESLMHFTSVCEGKA
ncbi:fimbria/pilus periplasmic chaperone [Edaphovirga cremea]|uniref:fimbria/pilus periplasmic chaperone n=1 Tax=Edaphovirga cremea TaxID=2267246 RepID=UPI0039895CE6